MGTGEGREGGRQENGGKEGGKGEGAGYLGRQRARVKESETREEPRVYPSSSILSRIFHLLACFRDGHHAGPGEDETGAFVEPPGGRIPPRGHPLECELFSFLRGESDKNRRGKGGGGERWKQGERFCSKGG